MPKEYVSKYKVDLVYGLAMYISLPYKIYRNVALTRTWPAALQRIFWGAYPITRTRSYVETLMQGLESCLQR
jgi:hypothetical protein